MVEGLAELFEDIHRSLSKTLYSNDREN